jgi:4-aminobutyrate aminotransferase/(S)-3-amino-2-methylpropionate transaminase
VGSFDGESTLEHLLRIDAENLSWADTVHYVRHPIVAAGCRGELVIDHTGRQYVDTQMWHSTCNFGYGNPVITDAVSSQLRRLPQVSSDFLHEEKLLLAESLCQAMYERTGLRGRVMFNVSGTLAVEDALKIARRVTGLNGVAAFMGGYHGRSLAVSAISSSHRYRQPYNEFAYKAHLFPYGNCDDCFYSMHPDTCGLFCGDMVAKHFSNEFFGMATETGTQTGALLIEICQGRGYTVPPADFYARFIPDLRQRGVLIIDDEIQVGMFRTGKLFAFEHFGVVPDIVVVGKSLTNGLSPLSAVWAREGLADPGEFGPGHAHSNFGSHSLGTAAALATWRYMESQDYSRRVPASGSKYLSKLMSLKEAFPFVRNVSGIGLLANMVFADDRGRPYSGLARVALEIAQEQQFCYGGEEYGLILNAGGYSNHVLKFAPMLDISDDGIERQIEILRQVLNQLGSVI